MGNEFKNIKYYLFENFEVENNAKTLDKNINRYSISSVKNIPRLSLYEMIGLDKDLTRMKIDVFGFSELSKTGLIRKLVYNKNFQENSENQNLIKYCWIPTAEVLDNNQVNIEIDLWNIPTFVYKSMAFHHLANSGISMIIFNEDSSSKEIRKLLKMFYLTKRNLKIIIVILKKNLDNCNELNEHKSSIQKTIDNFHSQFWKDYNKNEKKFNKNQTIYFEFVKIINPIFQIDMDSDKDMKDFKTFILKLCLDESSVKYSEKIAIIIGFLRQLRSKQFITIELEDFQQELLTTYATFLKNETEEDFQIEDLLNHLIKLGEIFIGIGCGDSSTIIIQPLKYIEAVNILYSNPDNQTLKIESRRFWMKSDNRPNCTSLASMIERAFENNTFIDCILPILLQNLNLSNDRLYMLCRLMLSEAVLIMADLPHLNVVNEEIAMPYYPSFSKGVTYVKPNKANLERKESVMKWFSSEKVSSLSILYKFSQTVDLQMLMPLIYFIGGKIGTEEEKVKWFKFGIFYIINQFSIKIEINTEMLFEMTFYANELLDPNDLPMVADIVSNIIILIQVFFVRLHPNLQYNIRIAFVDKNKKEGNISSEEIRSTDTLLLWVIKNLNFFIKDIEPENEEPSLTEIKRNTTLYEPGIEKPNSASLLDPGDNLEDYIPSACSSTKHQSYPRDDRSFNINNSTNQKYNPQDSSEEDNQITPFDLRRSTSHALENMDDLKLLSSADEEKYLIQIANSYIATIFTQAAVELISLQVDDQHKSLNRDPLVIAAQRDIMTISANMASAIQTGDYQTSGKVVLSVANAVQRAIKRKDQYNNPTKSKLCMIM